MLLMRTVATDEAMSLDELRTCLRRMQKRYRHADRETKKQLLGEMGAFTGQHRKSLICRLNGDLICRLRRRERDRSYGPMDAALQMVWEGLDYVCTEHLQPNLVSAAELLAAHGEPMSTPDPGRSHSPSIAEPGYFEMDLVHHCGDVTNGEYVYTLQLVDVATGWSCCRAFLRRSYVVVQDALAHLLACLPFPVQELHADNGGEFLNGHLLSFLGEAYPELVPSRCRHG